MLNKVLRRRARLENDGVKVWGIEKFETSYSEALAILSAADAHFDAKRFDAAAKDYRQTLSLFDRLENSRPDRLRNAIQTGTEALDRLDDKAAKRGFKIALSLDPTNSATKHGLSRAGNLKQVLNLVQAGQAFEAKGELDQARTTYAEAVALDGNYQPARQQLRRIDELILAGKYQRAISAALAALERKEYTKSRQALDQANRLRPDAPEVRDIGLKVKAARQLAALERIRRAAARFEADERWAEALQAYERALRIDKNTSFAMRGKARAVRIIELTQQVDYYLANPERLQSPDPRAHAQKVFEFANALRPVGAKLRARRERLRILIEGFNIPRPVILRSDEKTDVTVYKVGHFGQFSEHRLELLPGVYTAVGSRAGYRDVRIRFSVPSSSKETAIDILCKDRI